MSEVKGGKKALWDSREDLSGGRESVFDFIIKRTVGEEGRDDFDDFDLEIEGG